MIKDLDAINSSKTPVLAPSKRLHPNYWTWVLFAGIIGICFYKAIRFRYSHLIFNYPFISYDGFQWISDSLHYLDSNIEAIHRNPALPLTFALLRLLGLVDLYPFMIAGLTASLFLSAYWLMRAFVEPPAARIATLFFFLVFRIHNFFDYILADPWCVVLITLGLASLLRVRHRPSYLVLAAVFFGASLNYQYAAAFAAPALFLFLFLGLGFKWIKNHWKIFLGACIAFIGLAAPQFIYKWVKFGSPFYSKVVHFELLSPHTYGLFHYFVNFFAFLGWPLALVVIFGGLYACRKKQSDFILLHFYAFCMFIFWVVLYLWLDVRFLLYFLPAWFVYAALAIEKCSLSAKLGFRFKPLWQRILLILLVYFSAYMSSIQVTALQSKLLPGFSTAFESKLLPVFPGVNLRFSDVQVSSFKVGANTINNVKLEYEEPWAAFLNFPDFFGFYRQIARFPRHYSEEFFVDLYAITSTLANKTDSRLRVGLCGDLGSIFENKLRIFNTIERNVDVCSNGSIYQIAITRDFRELGHYGAEMSVIYEGPELVLLKR